MSALVRLQDPDNFDCPVINAYKDVLCCSNPNVLLIDIQGGQFFLFEL